MHPAVIKSAALIHAGDLAGAERALTAIAEDHGDEALVAVLNEVPPKDLLAIMREFDSSKESILNALVTPEQFANAAVLEHMYGDPTHEHLRGMMNAVLYNEPEMAAEFLRALSAKQGGLRTLSYYFSDHYSELRDFAMTGNFGGVYGRPATPDDLEDVPHDPSERFDATSIPISCDEIVLPKVTRTEIADRDWKETAWVLRHELPEVFQDLNAMLGQGDDQYEGLDAHAAEVRARVSETGDESDKGANEAEESAL